MMGIDIMGEIFRGDAMLNDWRYKERKKYEILTIEILHIGSVTPKISIL